MSVTSIRLARSDDRHALIEIQRRASLAGYPDDVAAELAARPELFDMDPDWIGHNLVFVAEDSSGIVGFAVILPRDGNDAELEGIFVEPRAWRRGIGTLLLRQIEHEALAWGATRLHVIANPFVEAFYTANGFVPAGKKAMEIGPPATLMVKPVRGFPAG